MCYSFWSRTLTMQCKSILPLVHHTPFGQGGYFVLTGQSSIVSIPSHIIRPLSGVVTFEVVVIHVAKDV